jgi:alkanesulfonate monooxygenase SsuD/methylene tetrahydromethanopterin reductase-like flavin-dependent oxidoreductase (luciferase family)
MVAKMAETLDRLSGGRLILGLGGGSSDDEHRAFGLGVRTPREKVDGLEDAIRIIRGLWSEPAFTYEGRMYHTEAADIEPKPDRPIPIWLGTYGPRALRLTGRLADGWIPSLSYAPPAQVALMLERVLEAAREAGRDPSEITRAYNVEVRVGERVESDGMVAGPPEAIAERFAEFAGLGFTAFHFVLVGSDVDEQAERLAAEVVPAVREAV